MTSKLMDVQKRIEKGVVGGYMAIENGVVSGYKAMESGVVSGYKKTEGRFVEAFLSGDENPESQVEAAESPTDARD
ncbi:MAG: hypothetical protein LBN10_11975 [Propionibacteriaceae bacterium]|jgi:hypothetical protein|nr:hypothetical protein [Propionibacteriaceae bacterium]